MNNFLLYLQDELNKICESMEVDSQTDVEIYDRIALLTQEIALELEGVE